MMPAANQGVGMNMGFPDVCLTPAAPAPLPIPYPNIGMNAMSMPFVPNVMVSMAPAQNMGAKPLMTNGDNAGVAHPLCMQPGGTIVGNPRILIGGMPASHLCVPTQGNNFNNPVGSKLVPSVTNVLLGFRLSRGVSDQMPPSTTTLLRDLRRRAPCWGFANKYSVVQKVPIVGYGLGDQVGKVLGEMRRIGVRRLVLDLQGCRGGLVVEAARVALLLRRAVRQGLRTIVLIDPLTASAAELLAVDLQDSGAAVLVGCRSYGKSRACIANTTTSAVSDPVIVFTRRGNSSIDGVGVHPHHLLDAHEIPSWMRTGGWR